LVIIFSIVLSFLITRNSHEVKIPDHLFDYSYKSDILPKNGFFLDTHSHTTESDGHMTAEQNIRWHIANGFHAMVVSDHNTGKANEPSLQLQKKYPEIVIIPGIEWTTLRLHMNFIGIKDYPYEISLIPTDEQIIDAIKKAKKLGAVVMVDHITWTKEEKLHRDHNHPTRKQLLDWGVDGFEIYNTMRWHDPKTIHIIDLLRESNQLSRPVFFSTGTDIHNPLIEFAAGWTEMILTPQERDSPTIPIVLNALREGRTRIWVDNDYREPYEAKNLKRNDSSLMKKILAPFYALRTTLDAAPGRKMGAISILIWIIILYFPLRWLFSLIATI